MYYVLHCVQLIYSALLPLICIAQQLFRKEKKSSATKKQTKLFPTWKEPPLVLYYSSLHWGKNKQTNQEQMGGDGKVRARPGRWEEVVRAGVVP